MTNTLKIQKIRNVKTPTRAHSTDAGIDFYVPSNLTMDNMQRSTKLTSFPINAILNLIGDIESITIKPNESVLIPSGIKVAVPDNFALIMFNKSGIATKQHLDTGACVIDSGYRDEIHLHLVNTSDKLITIYPGDKIIQGIVLPISTCVPELVEDINALGETDRGLGGFGSTANY